VFQHEAGDKATCTRAVETEFGLRTKWNRNNDDGDDEGDDCEKGCKEQQENDCMCAGAARRHTSGSEQEDKYHDGCDVAQPMNVTERAAAAQEHHDVEHDGHGIPATGNIITCHQHNATVCAAGSWEWSNGSGGDNNASKGTDGGCEYNARERDIKWSARAQGRVLKVQGVECAGHLRGRGRVCCKQKGKRAAPTSTLRSFSM
jgi:hypothetical protein